RKTADQVKKSRGSRLLEPMNPFERRLIHTALNDMEDIDTKSEGEGLYKQVRIMYRGNPYRH
ncbi:MAG: protein jag, partial [Spirochaetales bacterium]|nr:protein jag [Spirochaetales bacterium]